MIESNPETEAFDDIVDVLIDAGVDVGDAEIISSEIVLGEIDDPDNYYGNS